MADPRHALGISAEALVERWLVDAGWTVVARRCRPPGGGEIDLLAIDPADTLVAIEVRARRTRRTGSAAASIDARRTVRLRRSVAQLAPLSGCRHAGLRVDLVTVEPIPDAPRQWRLTRIPGIG